MIITVSVIVHIAIYLLGLSDFICGSLLLLFLLSLVAALTLAYAVHSPSFHSYFGGKSVVANGDTVAVVAAVAVAVAVAANANANANANAVVDAVVDAVFDTVFDAVFDAVPTTTNMILSLIVKVMLLMVKLLLILML